jgi:hypothetical protein
MQLGRKLAHGGYLNAVTPSRLVHVLDWRYLVYSGASYSILPHRSSASPSIPLQLAPLVHLFLAGGEKEFTLSFSGHLFKGTLLLADVKFPIINVDFLRHHKLLVDPAENHAAYLSYWFLFFTASTGGSVPYCRCSCITSFCTFTLHCSFLTTADILSSYCFATACSYLICAACLCGDCCKGASWACRCRLQCR